MLLNIPVTWILWVLLIGSWWNTYNGLWNNPLQYNWLVVHPLYKTTNQGPLAHCSPDLRSFRNSFLLTGRGFGFHSPSVPTATICRLGKHPIFYSLRNPCHDAVIQVPPHINCTRAWSSTGMPLPRLQQKATSTAMSCGPYSWESKGPKRPQCHHPITWLWSSPWSVL